jgi:hypothetical protein
MNNKTIYAVKSKDYNSLDEVYGFFDSYDEANAFINRFKTIPKDLEIVRQVLNPEYITDKGKDPYRIVLRNKENVPFDVGIFAMISQGERAKNEEYFINFYAPQVDDDGTFEIMLFAGNEEQAIRKAIVIRDAVINSGEWELAYTEAKGVIRLTANENILTTAK